MAERVRDFCSAETMPALYRLMGGDTSQIQAKNITDWIRIKDEGVQKILDEILEIMARTTVNTTTILAPDQVIIYGEMFEIPEIEERFIQFFSHFDPSYRNGYIMKSDLSGRIDYIGPLAVVVNEMFLMTGSAEE